jgi:predicted ArsR family transcriptional regulator
VGGETDSRGGRSRRDRLPRNRQRERVLQLVRQHHGAVDAVELASQTGLHVTTVRFHLDTLCDEGLVTRTRLSRPGAGRPRTGYVAIEERLDYRILSEILAMELGRTEEARARRAQHVGERWAGRLMASRGPATEDAFDDALDHAAQHATEVFTQMGFAAELAATAEPTTSLTVDSVSAKRRERVIRLHDCPLRDLARSHPEVGCRLHLGLLQGLITGRAADGGARKSSRPSMSAQLEPFVEPELCLARVVAQ